MVTYFIIVILAFLLGIFGWAQVIGSIQNISRNKRYLFTLILWLAILGAGAYFAIARFNGLVPLLIGYVGAFIAVARHGKVK